VKKIHDYQAVIFISLNMRHCMANHKSAKKSIRQIETRTLINNSRKSRIKTFIKKVEAAITLGDQSAANLALRALQPEIFAGVHRGVVRKETASRKISRLNARVKGLVVSA
jgi:small subunit ribosomal protein S20